MSLEFERAQKLLSNSWESSEQGLPLRPRGKSGLWWEGPVLQGLSTRRGRLSSGHGGHLGLSPWMESQPNSTAQCGEITMERVYLGFTVRKGVKRHLQIASQLWHPGTRV